MTDTNKSGSDHPADLPLFYKTPVVLQFDLHGQAGIKRTGNYQFAAGVTAVPLGVGEFMPAIRHYPIVFSVSEKPMPLAVLGIKQGENLFVDKDGAWKEGTYIPAYVRRYPFIIAETPGQENRHLAVDTASDRFVAKLNDDVDGDQMFDPKGLPTKAAQDAMTFCQVWQEDSVRTEAFTAALSAAGLLQTRRADMQLPDGKRTSIEGFRIVDQERLAALPAEQLKDWFGKGWLDLIGFHRASYHNWQLLLNANPINP